MSPPIFGACSFLTPSHTHSCIHAETIDLLARTVRAFYVRVACMRPVRRSRRHKPRPQRRRRIALCIRPPLSTRRHTHLSPGEEMGVRYCRYLSNRPMRTSSFPARPGHFSFQTVFHFSVSGHKADKVSSMPCNTVHLPTFPF